MKAPVCLAIIIAFILTSRENVFSQVREFKFKKVDRYFAKDTVSDGITKVTFMIDTLQREPKKGLIFSLKIKNQSLNGITILNPLDFLGLSLLDDYNKNVLISQSSRYKIRDKTKFSYTAFHIEKVKLNDSSLNIDLNSVEKIQINSNETLEIFLAIKEITDQKKQYLTNVPIRPGKYLLTGTFSTVSDVKHEVLILNPLTIILKAK